MRQEVNEIEHFRKSVSVNLHRYMLSIKHNAVFVVIHIGGILEKPVISRNAQRNDAVSYTHLDVYKRQGHPIPAKEVARRAGDPAQLIASSDKAKKVLGWNPQHDSLEEIISTAWNWHKNHPNGF